MNTLFFVVEHRAFAAVLVKGQKVIARRAGMASDEKRTYREEIKTLVEFLKQDGLRVDRIVLPTSARAYFEGAHYYGAELHFADEAHAEIESLLARAKSGGRLYEVVPEDQAEVVQEEEKVMFTERVGDVWQVAAELGLPVVVPVNCAGTMGAGVAKQAADRYPGLDDEYRNYLQVLKDGRSVFVERFNVVLFPTKYHWKENADIDLIRKAALSMPVRAAVMPRVGCGLGRLQWSQVSAVLKANLPAGKWYAVSKMEEVVKEPRVDKKAAKVNTVGTVFSNFHPVRVTWKGVEYPSVENAYQAAKLDYLRSVHQHGLEAAVEELRKLLKQCTPAQAKAALKQYNLDQRGIRFDESGWNKVKVEVMRELLRQKFSVPELRDALLATGDAQIVEENDWGDTFWGVCTGCAKWWCQHGGQNMLGKLLMDIREELKMNTSTVRKPISIIVGTRTPSVTQINLCKKAVEAGIRRGFQIMTGGAEGIDAIVAKTAHALGHNAILVLPWRGHSGEALPGKKVYVSPEVAERGRELVQKLHPAPERLTDAAWKLHIRNYAMLVDLPEGSVVVAFPKMENGQPTGGTAMMIRMAVYLGIKCKVLVGDTYVNGSDLVDIEVDEEVREEPVVVEESAASSNVEEKTSVERVSHDAQDEEASEVKNEMVDKDEIVVDSADNEEDVTAALSALREQMKSIDPAKLAEDSEAGDVDWVDDVELDDTVEIVVDDADVEESVDDDDDEPAQDSAGVEVDNMLRVDPADTGVITAGNWFVLTGRIAELVKARKVFDVVVPSHSEYTFRIDGRLARIDAELENGTLIVSVQPDSAEGLVLGLLSAINKKRAEMEGYREARSVSEAANVAEDEAKKVIGSSRPWLRRGRMRSGVGALGTVSPAIPNAARQKAENRWQKKYGVVYVGVGVKLLRQILSGAGMKKVTLADIKRLIAAVNSGGLGAFLFRNPVTEITNAYRRVHIVGVMGSNALHLPPDVAKEFYGDFDGDLYFLCMLLTKVKEAMSRKDVDLRYARITENKIGDKSKLVHDLRLMLESVGTKVLPTSMFEGILALIGADARSGVGALHVDVVSMIGQVARIAGPEVAVKFGDAMLPLLEVIMDAGKETSKVKQMDFGLPFVDHLVSMMSLRTPAEYALALAELAEYLDDFFGENNEFSDKVREAAMMMEEVAGLPGASQKDDNIYDGAEALEAAYLNGYLPTPETFELWLEGKSSTVSVMNTSGSANLPRVPAGSVMSADEIEKHVNAELEKSLPVRFVAWNVGRAARQFDYPKATCLEFIATKPSTHAKVFNGRGEQVDCFVPSIVEPGSRPFFVDAYTTTRYAKNTRFMAPYRVTQKRVVNGKEEEVWVSDVTTMNSILTEAYRSGGRLPYIIPVIRSRVCKVNGVEVKQTFVVLLAPVMVNYAKTYDTGETGAYYETMYRPIVEVGPVSIVSKIGDVVTAVRISHDGRDRILGGRFAFGKIHQEIETESDKTVKVEFGIVYQDPFVVLIDEMIQAVMSSSLVKVEEIDGKRFAGSINATLIPIVQRVVNQRLSAMFDTKNDAESKDAVKFLKHMLYVDDVLLGLIRRPKEVLVRLDDGKRKKSVMAVLPRRKEIGYVAMGELINQLIRRDGRKRIYLPLKKDASRILWFDPADRAELEDMGIRVVATNFRRSVREQLPLVGLPFIVNGKEHLPMEVTVAFANADWLVAPVEKDEKGNPIPLAPDTGHAYTSVEGMVATRPFTIPVTRSVQIVLSQGEKSYAEQILAAIKTCGLKAQYIVYGGGKLAIDEKAILACENDWEKLSEFGINFSFESVADMYTIVRASVKVGADATPDAFKLMFTEGTIKGVASVLHDQKIVAVMGDKEHTVDIIAPATAVVEKKTGTVVFYGLAQLFGYTDLIEAFEAEILASRANYEVGDNPECQKAEMEIAARYAQQLAERIKAEHPGVDYNVVPLYAVEGDKRKAIGTAMVLKLHAIALPHTSATIGREDNFGSQMLLRQAAMYKRDAAVAAGDEAKAKLEAEAVEVFRIRGGEVKQLVSEVESLQALGRFLGQRRSERVIPIDRFF